ncbi:ribulose-1,5 bisphosphate carboxylase/oxygenase large subunit N-methyltransferase, chloroplastic isoform X2 [Carica papaya]|uniref:ribulose-1,5 bisphosphate carboxylase/oxygenase large subunit N-methyltransferase, chloroplastic isoform X2 n=1 Tax=Carica papaya TaxID=3649 RepID=UPI000B8CAC1E|nr:ribulose-1,5 bisphosphate carboxylase/oxygenase large subunit N-methyltransferase, chloroplastic isoform X2 [Carica papaya]
MSLSLSCIWILFFECRSLFASKAIQTGDCIMKVPYNVQLTPDDLSPKIKSLLADEIGNISKLATIILFEQSKGQDSQWAPYIGCLPQPGEIHSTIFWGENEFDMIRCSSIYQETINQKAQIEKEFLAVKQAVRHCSEVLENTTLKDFMHACALVGSRAWGSSKGLSLIPFADFLNHEGITEAIVLSDEDRQLSEVIADRNYAPGEEVVIRYGRFSNATLLLDFGFTLPYNIHDQVQIEMKIPSHDPLCQMKLELMQRHHLRTVKDVSDFNSFRNPFTIKEVKSATGKGKGIPQSLRAFARVLCCTSIQELNELAMEAVQNDGRLARRPLRICSKEIEAHKILLSHITQLIEEYNVSLESLETVNTPSMYGRFALRKQMARDLLTGELRILKSAAAWLSNYCTLVHH